MSTILQICQDAAVGASLSLHAPETLFEANDEGDTSHLKLLRALTKTVKYLAANDDWQALKFEHVFTSTGSEVEAGAFPNDFLRFVPQTLFDRTRHWKLPDPLSPEEWQARKALLATTVIPEIIVAGGQWRFAPRPPPSDVIAYWYITNAVGKNSSGTKIQRFSADTDTTFWDDELLILGIEANYLGGEKMDNREEVAAFEAMRANRQTGDGGRKIIDMGSGSALASISDRLARLKSNAVIDVIEVDP